jgi:hypothetical protein
MAIKYWATYLKRGGRLVVDVPHTRSMLALKILDVISDEFGVEVLGRRTWIQGSDSLGDLMESAGLDAEVVTSEVFGDISAKTKEGRTDWGVHEGG